MRIRRDKKLIAPSTSVKKFTLIGGDEDYAADCWGFYNEGKGLVCGPAVNSQKRFGTMPGTPLAVYYSCLCGALYFVTADGVYLTNDAGTKSAEKICGALSVLPFFVDMFIDDSPVTVMFSGTYRIVCDGATCREYTDERSFSAGAMHCGRFFGADAEEEGKLWWAASHAEDWTEGIAGCGYTYLPPEGGKILRLFSYEDRLVAVREQGITIIKAYGEPQHYAVEDSAPRLAADGIIAGTCALAGGKIFFATAYALYSFDGNAIKKVMPFGTYRLYSPENAVGMGDVLYVRCVFNGLRCVLGYDCANGSKWISYTLCTCLCVCDDGVYFFSKLSVYMLDRSERSVGSWTSRQIDFGTGADKRLRKIYVKGDGTIGINVICDGTTRNYMGAGWHAIGMCGKSFSFSISSNGSLEELIAEVEVRNGI